MLAGAAALAAGNVLMARWAEHRHPPRGQFLEVDGVRVHYRDLGQGTPVVLIHGNVVDGSDYHTSGVAERLESGHRVIVVDRPGFGYTTRPGDRIWTAAAQAALIHQLLQRLGVERPVVVGHSWGTMVALELALSHQADTAGLVLISGYYFGTVRLDSLMVAPAAMPVLGTLLRYTISPLFGLLTMPLLTRALFRPGPRTQRFRHAFSPAMSLRPWQIRATAADGTLMVPGAVALQQRYARLKLPTVILAGAGDQIVSVSNPKRLHTAVAQSVLRVIPGAGHMLHHQSPGTVVDAVNEVTQRAAGTRHAAQVE